MQHGKGIKYKYYISCKVFLKLQFLFCFFKVKDLTLCEQVVFYLVDIMTIQ